MTIDALRAELDEYGTHDTEWHEKMWHRIPSFPVVDSRMEFAKEICKDKTVLSLGHSGPMKSVIEEAAERCHGIDLDDDGAEYTCDLDEGLPVGMPLAIDLIYAGEVLEHLTNPGRVLRQLRDIYGDTQLVITVPNAFSQNGYASVRRGVECVNRDHVAYYSYWTLDTLCRKTGWRVEKRYWYHGLPGMAEGLIYVAR